MDNVEFLLIIFLILAIQKLLKSISHPPEWDRWAKNAQIANVVIIVLNAIFDHDVAFDFVWAAFLLAIVYFVYKEKALQPVRSFAYSMLPYVAVSLLKNIFVLFDEALYYRLHNYFDTAKMLAFIWICATWFISNRQEKVRKKDLEQRRLEELQNKVIAERKVELEVLVRERTAELFSQKEELLHALAELRTTQD
ncbi:MAG: hypothetical protein EOP42_31945, partial [Sphingobacteriaceae bacterium]